MYLPPEYQRTLLKKSIFSSYLQQPRQLRIYLPPGYQRENLYPVIYAQDGEQFFNFGRIATSLTKAILGQHCVPAIIVGIDVNLANRTAEYDPDGLSHHAYIQFFAEELIPWVQSAFPVSACSDDRILAGCSLGATVSLHLAFAYPNLFHKIISLSGAYRQLSRMACLAYSDCSWLEVYQLVGSQECAVHTERGCFDFLSDNRQMQACFTQQKTVLHYEEKDGAHTWGFWQQHLPDALQFFLQKTAT